MMDIPRTLPWAIVFLVIQCLDITAVDALDSGAVLQNANMYRAKHMSTPAMQWDGRLAAKARAYANVLMNMARRNNGYVRLIHDPQNKVKPTMGENLWYKDTWKFTTNENYCAQADRDWYAEIKFWIYAQAKSNGRGPTGHFTQMIWKNSKRVGYGVAVFDSPRSKGNKIIIVVAKYAPPGNANYRGRRFEDFTKNVQPLLGGKMAYFKKRACKNTYGEKCDRFAGKGYCKEGHKYEGWMYKYCCKSCKGGKSGSEETGGGSKEEKTECKDQKKKCPKYVESGYCSKTSKYGKWMTRNCCKSCKDSKGKKPVCKDKKEKCPKYVDLGYCKVKYSKWMAKNCCASCKGGKKKTGAKSKSGGKKKTGAKSKSGGGKKIKSKVALSNFNNNPILRSANSYRAKHVNTPRLKWDAGLAAKAKAYAKVLLNNALRNNGYVSLIHDRQNKVEPKMGENLWYEDNWKFGNDAHYCAKADKDWYDEIKDWSYGSARSTGGPTGHFTQMVWVGTTRVGYGVAVGASPRFKGNKIAIVVAKYRKPGNFNMRGRRYEDYTKNVQRVKRIVSSI